MEEGGNVVNTNNQFYDSHDHCDNITMIMYTMSYICIKILSIRELLDMI